MACSIEQQYRVVFNNEMVFSNIVQLYIVCKHGSECVVHYDRVCMKNVIGGILFQPECSEYLQNSTVDLATGTVRLNPIVEFIKDCYKFEKVSQWITNFYSDTTTITRAVTSAETGGVYTTVNTTHGRWRKINCNFIRVPRENVREIIEILYRIARAINCPDDQLRRDRDRRRFCNKRFKLSLS